MTTNSVGEVDEKRMDTSAGHVPQDDSLLFSKREVNSELFSVGQERQSAAGVHEQSLVRKKKAAKA
jgi:hypothetical protein